MKHDRCSECKHNTYAHCICGAPWISRGCKNECQLAPIDNATNATEWLRALVKLQGNDFGLTIGDLVSSREHYCCAYQDLGIEELKTSYWDDLDEWARKHLKVNAKELKKSIHEIIVPVEGDIVVFYFLAKDEASLFRDLKKSYKQLCSE